MATANHMNHSGKYPIRIVAERTGLTPAAIRAWERRYGIVAPSRSNGAQRLYTDADVERLRLVTRLSAEGYSLADLSKRSTATLARLSKELDMSTPVATKLEPSFQRRATIDRLVDDARKLNPVALRAYLMQIVLDLGPVRAMDEVLSPFLVRLGEAWACGDVSVAQEHVASSVVRDVLGWLLQSAVPSPNAPTLIATTIAGEGHEFGAMMAAAVAAVAGWRVLYLGANTPATDLARAARASGARVIVVGIVGEEGGDEVKSEAVALRKAIGSRAKIVAGGTAAAEHRLTLKRARIDILESRVELRRLLNTLWTRDA
jgi:DNA-binding transcriptional MerR regulator/methylmalonyl-CoA mutase cobalamin-binding subunit